MDDDDRAAAEPGLDIVVPRAPTDDGKGLHVVRLREEAVEVGELRKLEEGRPVAPGSEIVKLSPRDDLPAWNVEVMVPRRTAATPPQGSERRGPPQVASADYRRNWDATFGDDDVN